MVATKKVKADKVFLVLDKPHGITFVVSVPKKTAEKECRRISERVLIAANQYYLVPIADRRTHKIDFLAWIHKFLELEKIKGVLVEEAG
jgi:hypothetical protein